jgi:putative hydrolase
MAGNPFDNASGDNPFGGLPFFGDMMKALAGQGPLNWDMARQIAFMSAGGTESSSVNVDPAARIAVEQLVPVAQMHVDALLQVGADHSPMAVDCVTPVQWCHHTLEAYKPVLEDLASALAASPVEDSDSSHDVNDIMGIDSSDPMSALMANLMGAMAPAMLGLAVGSMVGQLSLRAFGQYDLLLPRDTNQPVRVIVGNVDTFADEWSVPRPDMQMWVLTHEFCAHRILGTPHVRDALLTLVQSHVRAFRADPSAVVDKMTNVDIDADNPMGAIQNTLSDPALLLGAVISPEQQAMRPTFDALLAALVGVVDWSVDTVSTRLLGGSSGISEAVRRRRIEETTSDRFVEHLLGIHHTREIVERGRHFVTGVLDRSNADALLSILTRPDALPTPAEVDAPGLWLARLGIDSPPVAEE